MIFGCTFFGSGGRSKDSDKFIGKEPDNTFTGQEYDDDTQQQPASDYKIACKPALHDVTKPFCQPDTKKQDHSKGYQDRHHQENDVGYDIYQFFYDFQPYDLKS